MAFIEWTDAFAVKDERINHQHRRLIEIINTLHEAMTRGDEPGILEDILDRLLDYTEYHFNTEEDALRHIASPLLEKQQEEHNRMTSKVVALNEKYRQGSATLIFEILDLLDDWLHNHVATLDQASFP